MVEVHCIKKVLFSQQDVPLEKQARERANAN